MGTGTVSEALHLINEKVKSLDAMVFQHLTENYEDLFNKASDIDGLHCSLRTVESKITVLSNSVGKLKRKVDVPFETLKFHLVLFRRLKEANDVLRKISTIALLTKRMQSRSMDFSKSASYVSESEYLFSLMDWEGVHLLESYKLTVEHFREDLVSQAWTLINTSYDASDQVQLGRGLQVFQHLGHLLDVTCRLLHQWQAEFKSALTDAVDVNALTQKLRGRQSSSITLGPGGASFLSVGSQATAFHVAIWTSLDGIMDKLELLLSRYRLLALTLLKKRDASISPAHPVSLLHLDDSPDPHPSLAELLLHDLISSGSTLGNDNCMSQIVLLFAPSNRTSLCRHLSMIDVATNGTLDCFMEELKSLLSSSEGIMGWAFDRLSDRLTLASELSPQVKDALEGEYPKLLKLVLDLSRRLQQTRHPDELNEPKVGVKPAAPSETFPKCILRMLAHFETSYLSRSLSRLFDQVGMAFPSTNQPFGFDPSQLDGLVQSAVSELAYAAVQYDLLCKVSRNISKTISLCVTKAEYLIYVGTLACQIVEPQTREQARNIQLINSMCSFGTQLELICYRRLRNLPLLQFYNGRIPSPLRTISCALENRVNTLCVGVLQPLLQSVDEAIRETLTMMHQEDVSGMNLGDTCHPKTSSHYMQLLQHLVSRVRRQYLSDLSQTSVGPSAFSRSSGKPSCCMESDGPKCFACGEAALQTAIRPFVTRWVDAFLYNAALVYPVNEHDLLRLAADCAEFELALAPLFASDLGFTWSTSVPEAHRRLNAFRRILSMKTHDLVNVFNPGSEELLAAVCDENLLPPSLLCQHLFSRASQDIRPPHETVGWSITQYVDWMLTGPSESKRLTLLRDSLAEYAREIQATQQKEYPHMFLVLRTFLQRPDDPSVLQKF